MSVASRACLIFSLALRLRCACHPKGWPAHRAPAARNAPGVYPAAFIVTAVTDEDVQRFGHARSVEYFFYRLHKVKKRAPECVRPPVVLEKDGCACLLWVTPFPYPERDPGHAVKPFCRGTRFFDKEPPEPSAYPS